MGTKYSIRKVITDATFLFVLHDQKKKPAFSNMSHNRNDLFSTSKAMRCSGALLTR